MLRLIVTAALIGAIVGLAEWATRSTTEDRLSRLIGAGALILLLAAINAAIWI